ncbi:hypothetical protein D8674_000495 [Pyrus ussuriensis x Pyrus communis]|uniref:Uncharacterized protein n=1 Tax=Pyrus ussuriensis x Pyrus communis TaxID=2448454 RepID=A0A5N5F3N5_9ROSA|nr:hypothetical protein D8674_000495 [Pyrus ussuriensis x Pyrus communis]
MERHPRQVKKKKKPGALADYKRLLRPLAPQPRRSPLRGILDIMRLQQRSSTVCWPSTLVALSGATAGGGVSKFLEIDMFKEVYVWPGDELTEQLHSTMMEKGQTVLEEVASQLPLETLIEEVFPPENAGFQIMTDTLD